MELGLLGRQFLPMVDTPLVDPEAPLVPRVAEEANVNLFGDLFINGERAAHRSGNTGWEL